MRESLDLKGLDDPVVGPQPRADLDRFARAGFQVVTVHVPLSEMFGYATDLRSATQGRATYTMQFDHYDEVPHQRAETIIARARGMIA